MKPLFCLLLALSVIFSATAQKNKHENHLRFTGTTGIASYHKIVPMLKAGMNYNMDRFQVATNITMMGGDKRTIYESTVGYVFGPGPFIILHAGATYEPRKRTFMSYKAPDAPSWSDGENIVLKSRVRATGGFTMVLPTKWEKASLIIRYSIYSNATEWVDRYPDDNSKEIQLRGNGVGQLHVNKWQEYKTTPSLFSVGIIKRITWSACDDPNYQYPVRQWWN